MLSIRFDIRFYIFHIIIGFDICIFFFFFNDTATTEIYTLSLHDALPIFDEGAGAAAACRLHVDLLRFPRPGGGRSEEHTSELQSQSNLVCRLLLEKKKKKQKI